MMKKFLKFVFCLVLGLCFAISVFGKEQKIAYAEPLVFDITLDIRNELVSFLAPAEGRINRVAGTDSEFKAAKYIHEIFQSFTGFEGRDDAYFSNAGSSGAQVFEYTSLNNEMEVSQNISFVRKSTNPNAKTVVLATHYDVVPSEVEHRVESGVPQVIYSCGAGVNGSAGAVAMLISLARYISTNDISFDFNLEFVFFGANWQNYVGAQYYLKSIAQNKNNYAIIINFDKIAVGENNYCFSQEFACGYDKFLQGQLVNNFNFKKYSKLNTYSTNDDGSVTHRAVLSDNSVFLGSGINVANIFSGNCNGVKSLGSPLLNGQTDFTNTYDDTIEKIEEVTGKSVASNLNTIANAVLNLLKVESFAQKAGQKTNVSNIYGFVNNKKIFLIASALVVIALFIVFYAVYDNMYKKSKQKMSAQNINAIVMKIESEVGDVPPELKDKIKEKIDDDVNGEGKQD